MKCVFLSRGISFEQNGGTKFNKDFLKIFKEKGILVKNFNYIEKNKIKKLLLKINLLGYILCNTNTMIFFTYPLIFNRKYIINELFYYILNKKSNKLVAIISDLDYVRYEGEFKIQKEINILKNFDYIIVHNQKMLDLLLKNGIKKNILINMEMGNNICDEIIEIKRELSDIIVFSGNLGKSNFLLNPNLKKYIKYKINLYGPGCSEEMLSNNIKYKGVFSTDIIIKKLEGSFGLIWDGDSIDTCAGNIGLYTKINNPSKFSQYIVAGLPIIVWRKSAVADIVEKYNIGFVIDSLLDINDKLKLISNDMYMEYIYNVNELRKKVANGYHMKKVIDEILIKENFINRSSI